MILLVEKELDGLVTEGIIKPVQFVDREASIVPVFKQDKVSVWICGGWQTLCQAYQQLLLDNKSNDYVVINNHQGSFRYNRLPFGVSSAPGVFQHTMETFLQGIQKCCGVH